MSWVDPPLITPDVIEDRLIDTVRAHHVEHLAAQERRRGLTAGTLEPLATVSHLASDGEAQSGDALPRCLIGWVGVTDPPTVNERDTLDIRHTFGIEVAVIGQSRRDTLRRRDWLAWCVLECLLQRTPRDDHVISITVTDIEPLAVSERQRIWGAVRALINVVVVDALALTTLPADDRWPPGLPGGPPAGPYDPPVGLPPATDIATTITREGIS